MTLKNGRRCRNKGRYGGLCARHAQKHEAKAAGIKEKVICRCRRDSVLHKACGHHALASKGARSYSSRRCPQNLHSVCPTNWASVYQCLRNSAHVQPTQEDGLVQDLHNIRQSLAVALAAFELGNIDETELNRRKDLAVTRLTPYLAQIMALTGKNKDDAPP
jgi:hypothetical protein